MMMNSIQLFVNIFSLDSSSLLFSRLESPSDIIDGFSHYAIVANNTR